MLGFLEKLTLEHGALTAADLASLRTAGLSEEKIEEAIHVCAVFNIFDRLADALGFEVQAPDAAERTARFLLARGYT